MRSKFYWNEEEEWKMKLYLLKIYTYNDEERYFM